MSSTLYCSNCKIDLPNDESMKVHYKSEFHRYNIKRHLVSLPPITLDQFQKKKTDVLDSRKSEKEVELKCDACNKKFASKATHKQHMESSKHKETIKNLPKEGEIVVEKTESPEKKVRVTTMEDRSVCLFCNEKSEDINENLVHMRLAHSFFVSDIKYIKNLDGLLKYLSEKIHKGCLCIYCENHQCKDFKSGIAVQNHMMDKGHCFMKTDEFDEYHKYYDFTKQMEAMQNKMFLGNENEPLKENEEYLEMESGDDDEDEENWEDEDDEEIDEEDEEDEDDEEEEEEEGEEGEKKEEKEEEGEFKRARRREGRARGGSSSGPLKEGEEGEIKEEKKKRIYRFKVRKVKVLESGELQLPNGTILGHRKYRHLYKQYFRESLKKVYFTQKALGDNEERALVRQAQENRMIAMNNHFERRMKIKMDKYNQVPKANKASLALGVRGNKSLMEHYRNSNPL